jgi:hypothetical protein
MLAHPLDPWPAIGSIDPDQASLFTRPAEPRKEEPGACGVRHRRGRDEHGHEEPQRLDEEMPFAALHLFPALVAPLPAQFCGLDALTVEAARRGVLVAARCLAHLSAQGVVEPLPVPAVAPWAEIPVHARPFWILMGEHPPFDAPIDNIKERMDHRPHIEFAVASTRLRWWDQIFDKIPFGISKVCRVWFGSHPSRIPNWCHLWTTFQTASQG